MVATVQQETSADEKVLEVMAPRVTKGHSSDGAEARVQSRAGEAPGTQKGALGSGGGRRLGKPACSLGWALSLPRHLAPLPACPVSGWWEPVQASSSLLGSPAHCFLFWPAAHFTFLSQGAGPADTSLHSLPYCIWLRPLLQKFLGSFWSSCEGLGPQRK